MFTFPSLYLLHYHLQRNFSKISIDSHTAESFLILTRLSMETVKDAETDPRLSNAEADPTTSVTHIGVASSFYGCTINTPSDALSPPGETIIKKTSREEESVKGEKKPSRRVPLMSISRNEISTWGWGKDIEMDDVLNQVDPSKLKYLKKRMEE